MAAEAVVMMVAAMKKKKFIFVCVACVPHLGNRFILYSCSHNWNERHYAYPFLMLYNHGYTQCFFMPVMGATV